MSHTPYHSAKTFDFKGLRIRELTPPDTTFASIAEILIPPGQGHRRARSTKSDKLYTCLSGEVIFELDDNEYSLVKGDVLTIPRTQWFAYKNMSTDSEALLFLIHVPPFDLNAEEFDA